MGMCPGCGAEVEFESHEARLLTGTCPSCHRVSTIVEGAVAAGTPGPPTGSPAPAEAPRVAGLECSECGSALVIEPQEDGSLELHCSECESVARFVRDDAAAGERAERGPERYRPRFEPRSGPARPPPGRPCRQCGSPLSFSTDEEGNLVGECAACGNRFTLPPRRDGPRSEGRGRYPPRGPPRYGRRPGGFSRGRPRFGGDRGPAARGGPDRGGPDDPRRRRRRPRE